MAYTGHFFRPQGRTKVENWAIFRPQGRQITSSFYDTYVRVQAVCTGSAYRPLPRLNI